MRPMIVFLIIAWNATILCAQDVEVRVNGQTVHGTLVRSDDDVIVVRRVIDTKDGVSSADMIYPRSLVDGITPVPSAIEEYAIRKSVTPMTFISQLALALWCRENGLASQAAQHAIASDGLEEDNAMTGKLLDELGYHKFDGHWQVERAYLAAHGLVKYDGLFWTPDDARKRSIYDASLHEQSDAAQQVKDLNWTITSTADRLLSCQKHLADLASKDKKLHEQEVADKAILAQLDKAPPKRKPSRRNRYGNGGNETQSQKTEMDDERSTVEADMAQITRDLAVTTAETASTQKRIETITVDEHQATTALPIAHDRLTKANKAFVELKQRLPPAITIIIPGIG